MSVQAQAQIQETQKLAPNNIPVPWYSQKIAGCPYSHRKGYSNELASFFRINTFGRLNDGFISIFSSHVAKIRL